MITFVTSQFQAFQELHFNVFLQETGEEFRTRFPSHCKDISETDLHYLIRQAYERGKAFDVVSAYDVKRLAECLLFHGLDFPDLPETETARKILTTPDRSGRQKMNDIVAWECFSVRKRS